MEDNFDASSSTNKLHLLGGTDQDVQRKLQQQKQLYGIGASFDESVQNRVSKKAALQINHQPVAAALPTIGSERASLLGKEAPEDKYYAAYLICFLQGVGMLFPWNAFITATDYFSDRFNGTSYESSFSNYFTFTFQGVNIFCFALSLRFQHLFALNTRIIIPLLLQFIAFFLTTVMVKVDSISVDGFFLFTMFTVIICGGCTAFYQGAMFGTCAVLPAKFTQSLMGGQALGGVIVSLASVFSLLGTDDSQLSAIAYFCVSVVVILACFITYFILIKLPIIKFYAELSATSKAIQSEARMAAKESAFSIKSTKNDDEEQLVVGSPVSSGTNYGSAKKGLSSSSVLKTTHEVPENGDEEEFADSPNDNDNNTGDGDDTVGLLGTPKKKSVKRRLFASPPRPSLSSTRSASGISTRSDSSLDTSMLSTTSTVSSGPGIRSFSFIKVWKKVQHLAFAVALNFFITLAVFPSITASVSSVNAASNPDNKFYNKLFVPVYCFLLFNIGDYFGRVIAGWYQFPSQRRVWIPVVLRIVFIPLFMLCYIPDSQFSTVFNNDAWPFVIMTVFSLTNGYLGSLCMMYAPALVEMHEKEVGGTMMAFLLSLGLSLGSLSSFGFKAIVTGKNPF